MEVRAAHLERLQKKVWCAENALRDAKNELYLADADTLLLAQNVWTEEEISVAKIEASKPENLKD